MPYCRKFRSAPKRAGTEESYEEQGVRDIVANAKEPADSPNSTGEGAEDRSGKPWKTAFLVFGSALLGATAVALWNRRALARIRSQALHEDMEATDTSETLRMDEEIF